MGKSGRPVIKCTDDTLREIASELQDKTIPEVAEKYGVSVPTMNKWIRKAKDVGYITRARVGNKPDSHPFTYHYLFGKELLHSLRRVLVRSFYDFSFAPSKEEGKAECYISVDPVKFSHLIGRAYCEKRSKEDCVLYMSPEEDASVYFASCIHDLYGTSCHDVLDMDPYALFCPLN